MIAVRKETVASMGRQVQIWAEELRRVPEGKNRDPALVALADQLAVAADQLDAVITNWPNQYGNVLNCESKPYVKKV